MLDVGISILYSLLPLITMTNDLLVIPFSQHLVGSVEKFAPSLEAWYYIYGVGRGNHILFCFQKDIPRRAKGAMFLGVFVDSDVIGRFYSVAIS